MMNRRHFVAAILGAGAASRLPNKRQEFDFDEVSKTTPPPIVTIRRDDILFVVTKKRG